MNVNDSENLAGLLEYAGFSQLQELNTSDPSSAPKDLVLVLVNTCCVRASAENKAFGFLSSLAPIKKLNKRLLIGFCGCIANQQHRNLKKEFPFIDIVFGPGEWGKLAEYLKIKEAAIKPKRGRGPTAWITIMEGCDNFCSYCIVPYVRGRERSRPVKDILDEIRKLDKSIYKEVVLLGQNVNSYKIEELEEREELDVKEEREKNIGLAKLLESVHKIDGIERIKFLTSHPRDMSDDIINAVRDLPKVCEYFHLPLQSGDDEILKEMNRGYTSDNYRKLAGRIRSKIPDATITSDAIAGFPGETDKQFKNTCNLIKELELDLVNTLAYSPRPGTKAEKMGGQVTAQVKRERLQKLMKVVEATALKKNKQLIGSSVEVMVDKAGIGRTRGNKTVKLSTGSHKPGDIIYVRIKKAGSWVLEGDISN